MGGYNAYFRLLIKEDGTYLELIPPVDGGDALSFDELQTYVQRHGYIADKVSIAKAIQGSDGEKCCVMLDPRSGMEVAGSYILDVADDNMTCTARFYPPSEGGAELSKDELIKDALGPHVAPLYISGKKREWAEYSEQVTQWETDRYLYKY